MDCFELVSGPVDVMATFEKAKSPDCGAVSLFVGTARNNFNGREVTSLCYEAYSKMAYKKMKDICEAIRSKWTSIVHIVIQHRLGEVAISENIIVVAISSPHRAESLAALTYLLDTFKDSVPIWKKETYSDNSGIWKENVVSPSVL